MRKGLAGLWTAVALSLGISLVPASISGGTATGLGFTALAAPVTTQPCGAGWREVRGDNLWPANAEFKAAAATGPNDVWLVGGLAYGHAYMNTLVERWDGKEWRRVPSPSPGSSSRLAAVAAISPTDVWAVGSSTSAQYESSWVTLIEHWDGTQWTIAPSPSDTAEGSLNEIAGLAAVGPNDVWAVGAVTHWRTQTHSPLILHWDGKRWSLMPSDGLGPDVLLYAVASSGPNDVWAAGTAGPLWAEKPVIAHWDGQTWRRRADAGEGGYLLGIAVAAPNDIWAVGWAVPGLGDGTRRTGVIRHWDGHSWTNVPNPIPEQVGSEFHTVAALAPDDVWVAGYSGNVYDTPEMEPATLHWDGARWTTIPLSGQWQEGHSRVTIEAVAPVAKGNAWVAGAGYIAHYSDPCMAAPVPARPFDPVPDPHDPAVTYFPPVQHTLRGAFRNYWETNGGLSQFGYPLTEQFQESSPTDGKVYTVQYFERNRFEWHPEHAGTPSEVQLGLLGRTTTRGRESEEPFRSVAAGSDLWFPQTGHTLAAEFRAYWQTHGGLPVFGYPISEAFTEVSPTDARPYLVQYFERNRFEWHPEMPEAYRTSLGLLGVQVLQMRGWLR